MADKKLDKQSEMQEGSQYESPGKPAIGHISSDSAELYCSFPRTLDTTHGEYLQVRYKVSGGKWKIYAEEFLSTDIKLTRLTANTAYVFKVRLVNDDEEGPYSPESDVITTNDSAAAKLSAVCVEKTRGTPSTLKIPLHEIVTARNNKGKTRKFVIGRERLDVVAEKTIMLIGATGTGKSTLVDGIVNFVLGVNWEDPYRFTVIDLEAEEEENVVSGKQAVSVTEWITCYSINPIPGSRLKYRLNIIDTPGFGDTRGLQRDREIINQIRELFAGTADKGIAFLDAVCFLAKAPDARLTANQTYIFHSIMSLFGKDIEKNISTLITFADGQEPPVIAALTASGLPFGDMFTFNNSALFSNNTTSKNTNTPFFWDMGSDSYQRFFNHLNEVQTQSLVLTNDVLSQRNKLENTIINLQMNIDMSLSKQESLRKEVLILNQHRVDMEANKDFEYEIEVPRHIQTKLQRGIHVTNCVTCNTTCHENCAFPDDSQKEGCCAMKPDGYCEICEKAGKCCHWTMHKNTGVVFSIVMVKKKETYFNKLKIYQAANGKVLTSKQLMDEIRRDIRELEQLTTMSIEDVTECNNKLKEIALNANPLTMTEHIDLLIDSEMQAKKPGFEDRIKSLRECKKMAKTQQYAVAYAQEKNTKSKTSILKRLMNLVIK